LGSLKITEEYVSDENKSAELILSKEILIVSTNWILSVNTTTYKSKKVTNGKQHS